MARSSRLALDKLLTIPAIPDWIRQTQPQTAEDASFFAGAALVALHPIAQSDHPIGRLWRQRLALSATMRLVAAGGLIEDEVALREAYCLYRPGDDPGPGGRILLAWRALTEPSTSDLPNTAKRLAALLELHVSDSLMDLLAAAPAPGQGVWSAISTTAAVFATSLASDSSDRSLALWLADIVLARSLNWPAPVPLLALSIRFADLSCPPHDPRELLAVVSSAYVRAAADAFDLHYDLACRARTLLAIAPKLRSRHARTTVDLLLQEDALPAAEGKTASSRANRHLFNRLVELGVVRELTGRASSQLYGL